ncbi:hypothetical protein ACFV0W_10410, partial [Streptomyces anulatus]
FTFLVGCVFFKRDRVSPDGVEPLRQPFVLTLGEHLDEEADVTGDCFEFRAVDQNGLEPKVFPLVEALRSAGDPSGDNAR